MTKTKSHGWDRGQGMGLVKRRVNFCICFTKQVGSQVRSKLMARDTVARGWA